MRKELLAVVLGSLMICAPAVLGQAKAGALRKDCSPVPDYAAFRPDEKVWHLLRGTFNHDYINWARKVTSFTDRPTYRPWLSNKLSIGSWAVDINHIQGGPFAQVAIAWIDGYFQDQQKRPGKTEGDGLFSPNQDCVDFRDATVEVKIERAAFDFGRGVNPEGAILRFWFQTAVDPPKWGGLKVNYGLKKPVSLKPGATTLLALSKNPDDWICLGWRPNTEKAYGCADPKDPKEFEKYLASVNLDFGFLLFLPEIPECKANGFSNYDCWYGRAERQEFPTGFIEFSSLKFTPKIKDAALR